MFKKLICLLLVLTTFGVSSCVDNTVPDQSEASEFGNLSSPNGDNETSRVDYDDFDGGSWLDTLESRDYGGYTFTVALPETGRFTNYENTEDMVSKAIAKRNQLVSEKYNIKIKEQVVREVEMLNLLQTSVATGKQYSDLISASPDTLSKLAAGGCLMNLYSLAYYDQSAAFCNEELHDKTTLGHVSYVTYDQLTMSQDAAFCTFINKNKLDESKIYGLAKKGEWTWDALTEACGQNGFGYYGDAQSFTVSVFATADVSPVNMGYGVQLSHNTEKAEELDEIAKEISEIIMSEKISAYSDDALTSFTSGRVDYLVAPINVISRLSESKIDFGIVPMPTFDGSIKSVLSSSAKGIAVPEKQINSDRTGDILAALTAASHKDIQDAKLKNYVNFVLTDNDSAIFLKKIYDSVYIDSVMAYSSGFSAIGASGAEAIENAVLNGEKFADIFKKQQAQIAAAANKYFR